MRDPEEHCPWCASTSSLFLDGGLCFYPTAMGVKSFLWVYRYRVGCSFCGIFGPWGKPADGIAEGHGNGWRAWSLRPEVDRPATKEATM